MKKEVFICTDLGPGDGGKGGIVHAISAKKNAHTIVKVGGAQGSHGVMTAKGQHFCFSQFGCGTFEGTRTHLTQNMLIEPLALVTEGNMLKDDWGLSHAFDLTTIEEEALCITPYHMIASKLREYARKGNPKGTVGIGGGEALRDSIHFPELAIRAKDLSEKKLREKLEAIRQQKIAELAKIISDVDSLWSEDVNDAHVLIKHLHDERLVAAFAERFKQVHQLTEIVPEGYLEDRILSRAGTVVVESSHGVLTDKFYGFHPHTTQLRTIPQKSIRDRLNFCNYSDKVVSLGVTRSYQIRHGAGPMVTASSEFAKTLIPGSVKDDNRFQGKLRVGPLDLVMMRYAIEASGGIEQFDGLAMTWFDQVERSQEWKFCDRYFETSGSEFFSSPQHVKVTHGEDDAQLERQHRLCEKLTECRPSITTLDTSHYDRPELIDTCRQVLKEKVGLVPRMMSFGPTEADKLFM